MDKQEEEDTRYCSNCKRDIATINYVMHEVHCRRNIILCNHCQEPVPRSEVDEHFEEYHVKVNCDQCQRSMEISQLEDHKKDDCPKRAAPPCEFCELSFPVCEIAEHKDYCGSRTEQCPLCGQFIKLKDQVRHDDSNCQFPPRKEKSRPNGANHAPGGPGSNFGFEDDIAPSFAMNELSRLMHDPSISGFSRTRTSDKSSMPKRNTTNPLRARPTPNPPNMTRNAIPTSTSRGVSNGRTGAVHPSTSSAANKSKNTNLQRQAQANRRTKPKPQNTDMDRQLAMHLAQDLQRPDMSNVDNKAIDQFIPERNGQDDAVLPCEFCSELFPMSMLIEHQTGCNPEVSQPGNRSQSPVAGTSGSSDTARRLNNSLGLGGVNRAPRSPPQMLDNFSPHTTGFLDYGDDSTDENFMLPCEFCDISFPVDSIIFHQANCDANFTKTPRATTPAANFYPSSSQNRRDNPQQRNNPPGRTGGLPKKQSDPSLAFLNNGLDHSAFRSYSTGKNHNSSRSSRLDIPVMPHSTTAACKTAVNNTGMFRASGTALSNSAAESKKTLRKVSNPSVQQQRYPVRREAVSDRAPRSTRTTSVSKKTGVSGGTRKKKPPGSEEGEK